MSFNWINEFFRGTMRFSSKHVFVQHIRFTLVISLYYTATFVFRNFRKHVDVKFRQQQAIRRSDFNIAKIYQIVFF
jgi:hypothetical protein